MSFSIGKKISFFVENEERVLAKAGDAVIFVGTLQHCAMPNHSKDSRSVLLIQYLPKFIRPMEDQKRMLKKNVGIPSKIYINRANLILNL